MKKGFTLVELLAVIIILSVIALIATPIVINVIDDSRKSAAYSSSAMVLSAAQGYYDRQYMKNMGSFEEYTCMIVDGVGCPEILLNGKRPDNAVISINAKGIVNGSATIGKYTYYYCDSSLTELDCGNVKTAMQIGYTNELSQRGCTDIKCSLDELFDSFN